MADSYLNKTISSTGNRRKFTISTWIKRSKLGVAQIFANAFYANSDSGFTSLRFNSNDKLEFTGWSTAWFVSTQVFRDTSSWYHIVVAVDTENSTAGDRVRVYVNGSEMTAFDTENNPSVNQDLAFNVSSYIHDVGANRYQGSSGVNTYNGFISHFALVDGQQLTPTSFGETDATSGIWKFKSPSGISWGTNGVHLKFENSGALGTDSSGQGNNYTVNGTLKQSIDTPSNVYPTLNPSFNLSDIQLTEAGMRTKNTNSNWKYINSTLAAPSGKWYCEHKININGGYVMVGVTDMQYATSQDKNSYTHCGGGTGGVGFYNADGDKYLQASSSTFASSYTTGDIIGCALDMDNNKVYFSKNGAWANGSGGYGSSTFDAAVGAITLPTTSATYGFAVSVRSSAVVQSNFGTGQFGATTITSAGANGNGSLFEYDVPSGYYALNTKNINTYG